MQSFYPLGYYKTKQTLVVGKDEKTAAVETSAANFRLSTVSCVLWKFQIKATGGDNCVAELSTPSKFLPVQAIEFDYQLTLDNNRHPEEPFIVKGSGEFTERRQTCKIELIDYPRLVDPWCGFLNENFELNFNFEMGIKGTQMLESVESIDLSIFDPVAREDHQIIGGYKCFISEAMVKIHSPEFLNNMSTGFSPNFLNKTDLVINEMLQLMHGVDLQIHEFNVKDLYKIAKHAKVPYIIEKCKNYLVNGKQMDLPSRLKLADEWGIWDVFPLVLSSVQSLSDIKAQKIDLAKLSDANVKLVTRRVFELASK